ncbi:MAG: peptidoglycan-binding protein [Anaerolineaceae bacterium]|nr:peptidoglycan-binding protein [Anaerolineaceae bacterium]
MVNITSPRFEGDHVLEACYEGETYLSLGSRGDSVRKIQEVLVDAGYPLPRADGIFGRETNIAVKMFQRVSRFRGKDVDGKIGPKTMNLLDTKLGKTPLKWAEYLKEGLSKLSSTPPGFPFGGWKYDTRYWEEDESDPYYRAYKPVSGVVPSIAVKKIFVNLDKWDIDCAIFPELALLYAYLYAMGDVEFDIQFQDLRLRQHETTGIERQFYDIDDTDKATFNEIWKNSPTGTKVMWTNRSPATVSTAWHNENALKSSKGTYWQDDLYDAHPLGSNLSEEIVIERLSTSAGDFPENGSEAEKNYYIRNNIYRHQLHLIIFP